jgi:hypothetical protein
MTEFKNLSEEARQEIRDFVLFKKIQETSDTMEPESEEPEEKP